MHESIGRIAARAALRPKLRPVFARAVSFACLASVIPCVALDHHHFSDYYYNSWFVFLGGKVLIWFMLPFLYYLLLARVKARSRLLFSLGIWWPFFTILSYEAPSFITALIAAWVAAIWCYIESMFDELWPVAAGTAVFLCIFLGVKFITFDTRSPPRFLGGPADASPGLALPKVSPRQSVYLLVFDELAASELYRDGRVSDDYPNFQRLSARSRSLPRATTNYDWTYLSMPSMLSGTLLSQRRAHPTLGYLIEPNLFDMVPPEQLSIWGGPGLHACNSLRYKSIRARCVDFYEQVSALPLGHRMFYDLQRLVYIGALNVPIQIANAVLRRLPFTPAARVARTLHLFRLDHGWAHLWDMEELAVDMYHRFEKEIGSVKNGLYFYHSRLPHSPYVVTPELKEVDEDIPWSFMFAEQPEDILEINRAYVRNVKAADTILGGLLDAIDRRDPDAIVIVTSDHGVARTFGHSIVRGTPVFSKEVVDIPFLLRLPDTHPLAQAPVSRYQHIDLVPTFCDLMEVSCPPSLLGKSIFAEEESSFVFIVETTLFNKYESDP